MIKSLYPEFQKWCKTGSIYIISDTHFDDFDCEYMDPNWIKPESHMNVIKSIVRKSDTLIHLGDVGDATYLDNLLCHKVLITGNHDVLSKLKDHFDEVFTGPLFIADRILLSHEPIFGLEDFCINIHGHVHGEKGITKRNHINLASDVVDYTVFNLGSEINHGILTDTINYHRLTIDNAIEKKAFKELMIKYQKIAEDSFF